MSSADIERLANRNWPADAEALADVKELTDIKESVVICYKHQYYYKQRLIL